jgi:hypothetical protein
MDSLKQWADASQARVIMCTQIKATITFRDWPWIESVLLTTCQLGCTYMHLKHGQAPAMQSSFNMQTWNLSKGRLPQAWIWR